MALLSIDMIREIQGIAETYATHERERVTRVNAAAAARRDQDAGDRQRKPRTNGRADG